MKKNGQASLEAIIVFALFLALLGIFIKAGTGLGEQTAEFNEKIVAISESKKCAGIIDSVFANSGGKPRTLIHNCVPVSPHQIQVNRFSHEKIAFTIAKTIELVQIGNQTILEVKSPDHYK